MAMPELLVETQLSETGFLLGAVEQEPVVLLVERQQAQLVAALLERERFWERQLLKVSAVKGLHHQLQMGMRRSMVALEAAIVIPEPMDMQAAVRFMVDPAGALAELQIPRT
jgi:hypothetical protein